VSYGDGFNEAMKTLGELDADGDGKTSDAEREAAPID